MKLERPLCTERYNPVSTANRSPITRQKVMWYQSREVDGISGPSRRNRGMGKMTVIKK
jgi:hypothetical protein